MVIVAGIEVGQKRQVLIEDLRVALVQYLGEPYSVEKRNEARRLTDVAVRAIVRAQKKIRSNVTNG